MLKMSSMRDELKKIAACKTRAARIPIKAANLAARHTVDKSSGQLKTSAATAVAAGAGKKLLGRKAKIGLGVGGTIAAWETGKQALRDYQLGRAIRKQHSR